MKIVWQFVFFLLIPICLIAQNSETDTVDFSLINLDNMLQDFGSPKVNASISGKPLRINGKEYSKGLGTHAGSKLTLTISQKAYTFHAFVGVDDAVWPDIGSVEFIVTTDGKVAWRSGIMKRGMPAKECIVNLKDKQYCELLVFDAEDNIFSDHANWADAWFVMEKGASPLPFYRKADSLIIQTPEESPIPKIHGKHIVGAKPGKEILYRLPVSGAIPCTLKATQVPKGLTFNPETGILSGALFTRGSHPITFTAQNAFGSDSRTIEIRIGDTISYAPIMGWSSWYGYWEFIKQTDIENEAELLVKHRLHDYGFDHILIDDGWQSRDHAASKNGLFPSVDFPDLKGLSNALHEKGLKFGIYSSPGKETCVKLPGSYGHETQDAEYFCSIGADYVKYDWCLYQSIYDSLIALPNANVLDESRKPYERFSKVLDECSNRDIFFGICQYGNNDVWKWARSIGGNSWRTTTDIQDNWWSMSNVIGFAQKNLEQYAGYNGWNDMDFLRVGYSLPNPYRRKTELTPNELYTHVSLWALLNSPLILSCVLDSLDEFTLRLLKNGEVLAINQDKLGLQGKRVFKDIWQEVWMKQLDSGNIVVGFFNRDDIAEQSISVTREQLGIKDKSLPYKVRNLWKQKDIRMLDQALTASVPQHGVQLLLLTPNTTMEVSNGNAADALEFLVYPNPIENVFHIMSTSNIYSHVTVELVDCNGQYVSTLINEEYPSGTLSIPCQIPNSISSGLYGLRIKQGFSLIIKPIIVVH